MEVYILWKVKFFKHPTSGIVYGPFCPICGVDLNYQEIIQNGFKWTFRYRCVDCKENYDLPYNENKISSEARTRVFAKELQKYTPINLDLPPTKLQTRAEDDKYFIGSYLTQKDGRRVAVVYVGEMKKEQSKKDYAQVFVDLDQKQMRYDITNKNPNDLLSVFAAEFDDGTVHEVKKKR